MKALVLLPLVLLTVVAGCGSASAPAAPYVVSATGRIGPLQIDRSDRAAVIAFAGRSQLEARGRMPGSAPYDALGYDCSSSAAAGTFPLAPERPFCRTVFWIDERTGRLDAFFTGDPRYSEGHGVRAGTATAVAERLLHERLLAGCEENLYFSGPTAYLTIVFTGGRFRIPSRHVVGGRVTAIVLHSRHNNPGVFDCE